MAKRGERPRKPAARPRPEPAPPKLSKTWRRTAEFVEGPTAIDMVIDGEAWFVEECLRAPAFGNQRMFDIIRGDVLDTAMLKKYERKKSVPTVFVAERWKNDDGDTALLFVEQGPHARSDPGPKGFPVR